jgi:calcineurin-like phosphoesterase family protein
MSVYFSSDPHLLHANIPKFRSFVDTVERNTELFFAQLDKIDHKRVIVYFLGDLIMGRRSTAETTAMLKRIDSYRCRKILILGNHDDLPTEEYLSVFERVASMVKYKEFWLTHAPVHPYELRGKKNIHGHTHSYSMPSGVPGKEDELDPRYFNACPDAEYHLGKYFHSLEDVRAHFSASGATNK